MQPFWGDTHRRLVVYLADELNQALPEHYRASLDTREILHPGDPRHEFAPARQQFIQIFDRLTTTTNAVTLIEVLVPVDKRPGDGMKQFTKMQSDCRAKKINRIVLDLVWGRERVFEPPIELPEHARYCAVTYPGTGRTSRESMPSTSATRCR